MTHYITELRVKHHVSQQLLRLSKRKPRVNELYERVTALGLTPTDIDNIACVAHEAVRMHARQQGDYSHEIWSNSSAEHKHSMRLGVVKRLEDPDEPAHANHERWLEHKLHEGWTWGETRDEVNRRNPAMVSYSELPPDFRKRNEIFMAVVKALDPRRYRT